MNINKIIRFAVIALVVLVFIAALTTYTVKFNETAVVSTFGKADENSVRRTEGLGFIIPYAQRVTKYDKRARYVEPQPETAQTQDARQLIVSVGLVWRVSDPLKFFKAMSGSGTTASDHYKFAEEILKTRLRGTMGELAQRRLDQILAPTQKDSKLRELEGNMLSAIRRDAPTTGAPATVAGTTQSLDDLGIEALSVGIVGVSLPQDTTRKVFDGMNTARQSIANETINQGKSQATTLRSKAKADADRITRFAERLASSIRAQGDEEAQIYLRQMREDADLAVFLRQMEFMKSSMGSKSTTLVLPTSMPGMEWFRPDAMQRVQDRKMPGLNFDVTPQPSNAGAAAEKPTPAEPQTEDRR